MLKFHFFNVAEGDAILLEYTGDNEPFRVLIDTGRRFMAESEGSLRHTAGWYLRKMGITFIDVLVITHLHVDHIADLPEIMQNVKFGCIYSTFFPQDPAARVTLRPSELKPVRDLLRDLNTWAECIQKANDAGTQMIQLTENTCIPIDPQFGSILLRLPNSNSLTGQNLVYNSLFSGVNVPEPLINWAAQSRNPNSLRIRVNYAGRTAALDGDYYAADAENEMQVPCDILKAAHHGDWKSMTPKLAEMLRPKYAVISCKREYDAAKDRPSEKAAEMLRKTGAEVFYTDCFAEAGKMPEYHEEILLSVQEDGSIRREPVTYVKDGK